MKRVPTACHQSTALLSGRWQPEDGSLDNMAVPPDPGGSEGIPPGPWQAYRGPPDLRPTRVPQTCKLTASPDPRRALSVSPMAFVLAPSDPGGSVRPPQTSRLSVSPHLPAAWVRALPQTLVPAAPQTQLQVQCVPWVFNTPS